MREHRYRATVEWTGNRGQGSSAYTAYDRDYLVSGGSKPAIAGSADPAFRGDPGRWNPEELLVASLSACHKLWYLHLCSASGIAVFEYRDEAEGVLEESADGGGRMVKVILRPDVRIGPSDNEALAQRLHDEAHRKCFIAASVNFPVVLEPAIRKSDR